MNISIFEYWVFLKIEPLHQIHVVICRISFSVLYNLFSCLQCTTSILEHSTYPVNKDTINEPSHLTLTHIFSSSNVKQRFFE
jgi:hypothetical protein